MEQWTTNTYAIGLLFALAFTSTLLTGIIRDKHSKYPKDQISRHIRRSRGWLWGGFVVATVFTGVVVFGAAVEEQFSRRLISHTIRTGSNEEALRAIERARSRDWITGRREPSVLLQQGLAGANLAGVELYDSVMDGINLEMANLERANLESALLTRANLSGATFQSARLSGARFNHSSLVGADLRDTRILRASFQSADLSASNLQGSHIGLTDFFRTSLIGANLDGVEMTASVEMRQANLENASLVGANLQNVQFDDSNLQSANLQNAILINSSLKGVSLRGANLDGVTFSESTMLPDGDIIDTRYVGMWAPGTDMARYTDPNHPDFWEPEYLQPGYEGIVPEWAHDVAQE